MQKCVCIGSWKRSQKSGDRKMRKFVPNKEHKNLSPSEEQIRRQKDFARLHHEYELLHKRRKKPLYRDPKFFLLLFLLGIILLLVLLESEK